MLSRKKKIDWLNHSLEFVVVLIGILIAFQLNKCSENKTKTNLISNHIEYIKVECKENIKNLNEAISHVNVQISHCDSLLNHLMNSKEILSIRNYSTKLLDMQNAVLNTSAYDVLLQSGDIRFLEDYDLKKEVISIYSSFENVQRINSSTQNLYDRHFYPYLKSNFDLLNWDKVVTEGKNEEEMYYSKEYINTISTYQYLLISKRNIYNKQKELISQLSLLD